MELFISYFGTETFSEREKKRIFSSTLYKNEFSSVPRRESATPFKIEAVNVQYKLYYDFSTTVL